MRPKIYIEEGYLTDFNLKLQEALKNHNVKKEKYNELLNRLKLEIVVSQGSAEVIFNGDPTKIKKIFKKDINDIDSYEDLILKQLMKKINGFSSSSFENTDSPALYLLNEHLEDVVKVAIDKNIYIKDLSSSFDEYVLPNSRVSLYIDASMNGIEKIAHRSQNVLIVDPYLFVDNNSDRYSKKIPNIAKTLKAFGLNNQNIKTHFSAVVAYGKETISLKNSIDELTKEMDNPNLTISVFAIPKKSKFGPFLGSNRYFLTDFCFGEYQHIFDRVGSVSANFFLDNINFDFKTLDYCKDEIIKRYNNEHLFNKKNQQKFGNILKNPLFIED